jgi:hypothetical protein
MPQTYTNCALLASAAGLLNISGSEWAKQSLQASLLLCGKLNRARTQERHCACA